MDGRRGPRGNAARGLSSASTGFVELLEARTFLSAGDAAPLAGVAPDTVVGKPLAIEAPPVERAKARKHRDAGSSAIAVTGQSAAMPVAISVSAPEAQQLGVSSKPALAGDAN